MPRKRNPDDVRWFIERAIETAERQGERVTLTTAEMRWLLAKAKPGGRPAMPLREKAKEDLLILQAWIKKENLVERGVSRDAAKVEVLNDLQKQSRQKRATLERRLNSIVPRSSPLGAARGQARRELLAQLKRTLAEWQN
jgi:hypothetical protein